MVTIAGIKADIIKFLKSFFASGRISNPVDNTILFQYDNDIEKTQLIIRDRNVMLDSELGRKPLIIIDHGAYTRLKNTLTHQLLDYNYTTGARIYADLVNIPFVLHCISPNDEEAETLAQYAGMAFWMHHDLYRPDNLHFIEFDAIRPASIIASEADGEPRPIFDVPVVLTVWVQIGYQVRRSTDILEGLAEESEGDSGPPIVKQITI